MNYLDVLAHCSDDPALKATAELERKLAEETRKKKFMLVMENGVMVWEEIKK